MFKGNKLIDLMDGRKNNLDFIRFIAALLVIFSHSFPLSLGDNTYEPLLYITNGQTTFGQLAVYIFFVTSGFLITQSFERTNNVKVFMRARVLRIFPALIVVVFLTSFVLGTMVTTVPIKEYLVNINTYTYLTNILLHPVNSLLPGVFEENIYKNAINGSLWTLQYEFLFYIAVAFLGIFKLLRIKFIFPLYLFFFILSFFELPFGETISHIPELFSFFLMGMLIYTIRDRLVFNAIYLSGSVLALILSAQLGSFVHVFMVVGCYLTFYAAYSKRIKMNSFSRYGDFSYGMYIFAFPIQQLITFINGGKMEPYTNFFISLPIILVFSFISWHLVEKRALKYKNPRNMKIEKSITLQAG